MTDQVRDYYFRDLTDASYVSRSNSELAALQQLALDGDKQAWNELWLHGVRLVHKICRKLVDVGRLRDVDFDDAIQVGNLAIGDALPYWSNNQGRYSTYVWVCIRKAVQKFLQEQYAGGITGEKDSKFFYLMEQEDFETEGWSALLSEFYQDLRRENLEDKRITEIDVEAALGSLSERELYILRKYYYEDMSDPEIGVLLGISKQAVGQKRNEALEALQLYFS